MSYYSSSSNIEESERERARKKYFELSMKLDLIRYKEERICLIAQLNVIAKIVENLLNTKVELVEIVGVDEPLGVTP